MESSAKWCFSEDIVHAELPRFAGSEQHALDEKGRLIIPARFRERLGPVFVLTIAPPDPCLALYPSATWVEFCERLEAVPQKDGRYRRFVRYLFAHTQEVTADAQGRMVVPGLLRAYAGIERHVVSVGLLTRVEIWAQERYAFETPPEGEVPAFLSELGL
ncbi:MAG: division/cell wall cluster transcriptional repressor MraZ [Candidatus Eremiobacteraeota bacterium]|nr:division/cell wall cluster transcriptional repressor MraZ [Candidatus Eremiobacteraeota bacterium]